MTPTTPTTPTKPTKLTTLRKFQITFHLGGGQVVQQRLDGVTVEAVEAALQQKLSQKELIFIADGKTGTTSSDQTTSGAKPSFTRIASERVQRYDIEEVER